MLLDEATANSVREALTARPVSVRSVEPKPYTEADFEGFGTDQEPRSANSGE